jgi:hypothetical protein
VLAAGELLVARLLARARILASKAGDTSAASERSVADESEADLLDFAAAQLVFGAAAGAVALLAGGRARRAEAGVALPASAQ